MITRPSTTRWVRLAGFIAVPALILLTLANAGADGKKESAKPREGEEAKKSVQRDGESAGKIEPRDGEGARKKGPRDGESGVKPRGPRDGEAAKNSGPRDGEKGTKPKGARDGESAKQGRPESADRGNEIVLRVLGQGDNVSIDGKLVPSNRLRGFLSEYLPAHAGQPVIIDADDEAPYKAVMDALDAARDNGAKKAALRTP